MTIYQQVAELLSQTPASAVYHVVMVLVVQATLGLALSQRRQDSDDLFAQRMVGAAAGVLLLRLLLFLAVFVDGGLDNPSLFLPPLERAIDSASVALLVWAVAPHPTHLPRLGTVILITALVVTTIMYAFLAQEWLGQVNSGFASNRYLQSDQAFLWDLFQLMLLGIGIPLIAAARQHHWDLKIIVLAILFFGHLASLIYGNPEGIELTQISLWARLSNFIAWPIVAALMYRHNLTQLIPMVKRLRPTSGQAIYLLSHIKNVVAAESVERMSKNTVQMVCEFTNATFSALALPSGKEEHHFELRGTTAAMLSQSSDPSEDLFSSWAFDLRSWPAIRIALEQNQQIELSPEGVGARQLHDLYHELDMGEFGSLIIDPLVYNGQKVGVLLVAAQTGRYYWTEEEKEWIRHLSDYVASVFVLVKAGPGKEGKRPQLKSARDQIARRELANLQRQLASMAAQLEGTKRELTKKEERQAGLLKTIDSRDNSIEAIEEELANRNELIHALREELASLKDSTTLAEETLPAELGASTLDAEWVLQTVSRYSGQLENAHDLIDRMEMHLVTHEVGGRSNIVIDQARRLRTPLTTLSVYADLLLNDSFGFLGSKQLRLVRHMKNGVEKMTSILNQLFEAATWYQIRSPDLQLIDISEELNTVLLELGPKLRNKNLQTELDIQDSLPMVRTDGDSLRLLLNKLLENACLVSVPNGQLNITLASEKLRKTETTDEDQFHHFARLSITDSGGSRTKELSSLIRQRVATVEDGDGDNISPVAQDLAIALSLIHELGGRYWVSSSSGDGTTVTFLLPGYLAEEKVGIEV